MLRNYLLTALLAIGLGLVSAQPPLEPIPYDVQVNGTPAPGYIFLSPRSDNISNPQPSQLMVLDSAGGLIWYAPLGTDTEPPFNGPPITDFKILKNGLMTYWTANYPGAWALMDSTFNYTDTLTCQGIFSTDEHDLYVDDRGHYFLICDSSDLRNASNLTTANGTPGSSNCVVEQQIIQELDPNRNVVSEWYTLDYYDLEDINPLHWDNPAFMDHSHVNSVQVADGFVTLSTRNINEITRYNLQTGDLVWRFGSKANEFTLAGDTALFASQHDARYTPEGNLYLFDNARYGESTVARYVEYELDTANMTATLVREHLHPAGKVSWYMGNAIHLPNDNVIVNWGSEFSLDGTTNLTEFAPNGDIVLDLNFSGGFFSYRVAKEPLPWKLERPEITCDDNLGTLSAPAGYNEYYWSNGETTPTISVTVADTYQVWVDYGVGYLASAPIIVQDPQSLCLALERPEAKNGRLRIFPNPVENQLRVELPPGSGSWEMQLIDAVGRVVQKKNGRTVGEEWLDLTELEGGMYYIEVKRGGRSYRAKVIHL